MGYIYLAEPIDQANGLRFSSRLRTELDKLALSYYSPADAWHWQGDVDKVIQNTNNEALFNASVIIAVLPAQVATVGVPMEIQQAMDQGKPVLVLTDIIHSAVLLDVAGRSADPKMIATAAWGLLNPRPEFPPLNDGYAQGFHNHIGSQIVEERHRQQLKFGSQVALADAYAGLENCIDTADEAKECTQRHFDEGRGNWVDILVEEVAEAVDEARWSVDTLSSEDHAATICRLRKELIEVAAVAVAWIEAIDQR